MKKIDLKLDFDAIRSRIELDKNKHKRGSWAKNVGVSSGIVTNVHGKTKQNPSLEYIISVAKYTGKSIEYYLWGNKAELKNFDILEKTYKIPHTKLVELFEQNELAWEINHDLIKLEEIDPAALKEIHRYIKFMLKEKMRESTKLKEIKSKKKATKKERI